MIAEGTCHPACGRGKPKAPSSSRSPSCKAAQLSPLHCNDHLSLCIITAPRMSPRRCRSTSASGPPSMASQQGMCALRALLVSRAGTISSDGQRAVVFRRLTRAFRSSRRRKRRAQRSASSTSGLTPDGSSRATRIGLLVKKPCECRAFRLHERNPFVVKTSSCFCERETIPEGQLVTSSRRRRLVPISHSLAELVATALNHAREKYSTSFICASHLQSREAHFVCPTLRASLLNRSRRSLARLRGDCRYELTLQAQS